MLQAVIIIISIAGIVESSNSCHCGQVCKKDVQVKLKENVHYQDDKLIAVVAVQIHNLPYNANRFDLLKNQTSFTIDWLPMPHDVVEPSRRPPTLANYYFIPSGVNETSIILEFHFDGLNMKLRSTYEIRANSIYDNLCNRVITLTPKRTLNVTFECERIIGADCRHAIKVEHHAVCNLMRNYHTRIVENPQLKNNEIDVMISVEKNEHRHRRIMYFISYYGPCETTQETEATGGCIVDLQKSQVARFCMPNKMNCTYSRLYSITIRPSNLDEKYGIQICGVIDPSLEHPPLVDGKSKIVADMLAVTVTSSSLSTQQMSISSLFRTLIGYAFVMAFLFVTLMFFVIYKCATRYNNDEKMKKSDQYIMDEKSLTTYEDSIIGCGRFSTVFIGQLSSDWLGHVILDEYQRVAVKKCRFTDKTKKRQFFEEIEGAKIVGRHARLLSFIGTVIKNGDILHVMEYCGNGSLLNYLISRRKYMIKLQERGIDLNDSLTSVADVNFDSVISTHDLYRISSQICSGMIYLTSNSIVHNALCAQHVLITLDHNAKISDFGNVSTPSSPNCSPVEGLYKWNAIELLRGSTSTLFSDVWSYGVVLWEIFTIGGCPYYNVPDEGIKNLIEKGFRLQKPDTCTFQLYQLMRECWFDIPSDRPNFEQISERLSTFAQERPLDGNSFITISTMCDYYLSNNGKSETLSRKRYEPDRVDADALISESERLLGYRF